MIAKTHDKPIRVLFIFASDPKYVGGHFLSAITLAKNLQSPAIQIGFLIAPFTVNIPEFENANIEFHYINAVLGKRAFLTN